jgi:EAL domain-containing protein (putative c-di-GMP-specific phosphodiesterase class I)
MSGRLLEGLLRPGSLRALFQPVFDLSTNLHPHYLEGLIRGPEGSNLEPPEILFDYARRKRATLEVDRACLRTVLKAARALPDVPVGINLHASTLAGDLELLPFVGDLLTETDIAPDRIVVELIAQEHPTDEAVLLLNLEGLRAIGVRLALDDFGSGQANYRMLLETRPDYLKVDRCFIHGAGRDPRRQAFLDSVAALAARMGARVIAEGVEKPADLARVQAAGVDLVQGRLLGHPAPAARWQRSRAVWSEQR